MSSKLIIMAGIKKGSLVRVVKEKLEGSLEIQASDVRLPSYLFNSKGAVVELNDEYALVQFYVPTPNVWLRLDQLEEAK
jgi:mitochondrial fission protein ELM1